MVHHTLDAAQEELLKKSAHDLMAKGPVIIAHMLDHFFGDHPEMKFYFSTCFLHKTLDDNHDRPASLLSKALAHIFFNFVAHIHDIDKFEKDMERISYKHVSRDIKPESYQFMGDALVKALEDVIGKDNQTLIESWRHAYDIMSEIFVENEQRITKEIKEQAGGWSGFRKFRICEVKEEKLEDVLSEVDTELSDDEKAMIHQEDLDEGYHEKFHFYLEPMDGNKQLPEHKPGQYICARFHMAEGITHRNYTLETIADGKIAVSTKCEHIDTAPTSEYMRKNWTLGFEVEISAPMGQFLLLESLEVN